MSGNIFHTGKYVWLCQSEVAGLVPGALLIRRACEVQCGRYWCTEAGKGEGKKQFVRGSISNVCLSLAKLFLFWYMQVF